MLTPVVTELTTAQKDAQRARVTRSTLTLREACERHAVRASRGCGCGRCGR